MTRTTRTARVAEQVIREFDEAVARATGDLGEPGPVYLEIPTDVLRTNAAPNLGNALDRLFADPWAILCRLKKRS